MLKHVYFFNKSFPESVNVQRSLQSIHGIGRFYAAQVCEVLGIGPRTVFGDCSRTTLRQLQRLLQTKYFVNTDLQILVQKDVQSCVNIGSVRGIRHTLGLPVRGQRTRTNARTSKRRMILRKGNL